MSTQTAIRLLALAGMVFVAVALRFHKVAIDKNDKRIQAIEQILWATNGTLVITQESVGRYYVSWPNIPVTNTFTNSINVRFENKP